MAFVAIDIQLCLSTYQLTKSFESCHLQAERAKAYYEHFQMDIGCLCKGSQCKIKLMEFRPIYFLYILTPAAGTYGQKKNLFRTVSLIFKHEILQGFMFCFYVKWSSQSGIY
jgi:hypothetical protein